ncbi:queuosine precursor transporter [Pseudomonas azerbaijanoccidens]|uniref:queuosine precursor transporter n=1 Tax=Pseudomonas azerbaijanoccidentalis TaxID=2842347 RepID=UPI00200A2523|nr:queuosine precursor transporter [Pseudomonas azerbaijanoccidentalis]MCK8667189.1 queuosine precursor transporter [Pseudomonas azerbaijanoccidentalis]
MASDSDNSKFKLLGFENKKSLAVIMVVSTGKVVKVKLRDLLRSEVMDDFSKVEVKDVYRKFYSGGGAITAYEISDRHERSWMAYVVLNLLLFALYIFTNVAAAKLIYLEYFDVVVTPGVFLYPLTFLIVDLLNESYGLRLARRAIYFAFASNAFILVLLSVTGYLPGLPGWKLDAPYSAVISHVSSALVASSISFLFSEYVNSYLLCRIKELTNSRFLFLRVFFSTFFAVIIDSFIFCFIAFYGTMENGDILKIVYIQIAIKMCFAVFNVLPAYGARSLFKKYVVGGQAV